MNKGRHHTFIEPYDDLAGLINDKANELYQKLLVLDISDTDIDEFGKYYFANHHAGKRLYFSIQSSADIIYRSVNMMNKDIAEVSFIDYGAGLGTLFLLAGSLGFKKVYYNDYFPQWVSNARIICDRLGVKIDDFIAGDIDAVIGHGKAHHVSFDIMGSRNVVEHIYDLESFYTKLYQSGITTVCYSTTTANYHNIAMRLKHYLHHYKLEKRFYKKQREEYIKELAPGISITGLQQLIKLTRGRAFEDFTNCVNGYLNKKPVPPVELLGTNTCDCRTGVWAEHLITRHNYTDIIQKAGFEPGYTAGFWDTHYKYAVVNLFTRCFNIMIKVWGKKGYWLSPFVNVVAIKK